MKIFNMLWYHKKREGDSLLVWDGLKQWLLSINAQCLWYWYQNGDGFGIVQTTCDNYVAFSMSSLEPVGSGSFSDIKELFPDSWVVAVIEKNPEKAWDNVVI
jgi:hypothetical protein